MFRQLRRAFSHHREDRWLPPAGWEVDSSPSNTHLSSTNASRYHLSFDGRASAVTESIASVFGNASTFTDPYFDGIGDSGRTYLQDLNILYATDSSAGEFRSAVQELVRRQLETQWRILRRNVDEERSDARMSSFGAVIEGDVGERQMVDSMGDTLPSQIWQSALSHDGPLSQTSSGMTDEPPPPYRSQGVSEDLRQSSPIYSRLQSQFENEICRRWGSTPSYHSFGYPLPVHIPQWHLLSIQPPQLLLPAALYEPSYHSFLTESTRSQSPVCGHPGARHFEASPTPPSSHISHPEEGAMGHGLTPNLSISNTQTSLSAESYGNSFVSLSDSNTDSIESFDPLLLPRSASLHYSPPHSSVSLTMLLSLPPPYPGPCPSTSNESFITSSPFIPFSPSMTPNSSSSDLSFSSADSTSSSSPLNESPRQSTHLMQPPFG